MYRSPKTITWKGDLNKTAYIFYQGIQASQIQASRYIETNTMVLTTNELAIHPITSVTTIPRDRLWTYPEIDEINRDACFGLTGRMEHWAHGIQVQAIDATNTPYRTLYPTDETGTLHHYSIDASKASAGQSTDIQALDRKYSALMNQHPDIDTILYGFSRGAATCFSGLAKSKYPNVKICILEAVPSSMKGIVKSYARYIPLIGNLIDKYCYNSLVAYFALGHQHSTEESAQAKGNVNQFPASVPLVVVSSLNDKVVPLQSGIRLALKVAAQRIKQQQNGVEIQPVYYLQLENAGHNSYTAHNTDDALRYNNFIHAVYRKHNLPFVEEYANQGEIELSTADLTSSKYMGLLQLQASFWDNKLNRAQTREDAVDLLMQLKNGNQLPLTMLSICEQMPLFAKTIQSSYFFCQTDQSKTQLRNLRASLAAKAKPTEDSVLIPS